MSLLEPESRKLSLTFLIWCVHVVRPRQMLKRLVSLSPVPTGTGLRASVSGGFTDSGNVELLFLTFQGISLIKGHKWDSRLSRSRLNVEFPVTPGRPEVSALRLNAEAWTESYLWALKTWRWTCPGVPPGSESSDLRMNSVGSPVCWSLSTCESCSNISISCFSTTFSCLHTPECSRPAEPPHVLVLSTHCRWFQRLVSLSLCLLLFMWFVYFLKGRVGVNLATRHLLINGKQLLRTETVVKVCCIRISVSHIWGQRREFTFSLTALMADLKIFLAPSAVKHLRIYQ